MDTIGEAILNELLAELPNAGPAIQDDERTVSQAHGDAGSVSAIPHGRRSGSRHRATDAVERHAHVVSSPHLRAIPPLAQTILFSSMRPHRRGMAGPTSVASVRSA